MSSQLVVCMLRCNSAPFHITIYNAHVSLQLNEFDQEEFFYVSSPALSGMDVRGYVYIPDACDSGARKWQLGLPFNIN